MTQGGGWGNNDLAGSDARDINQYASVAGLGPGSKPDVRGTGGPGTAAGSGGKRGERSRSTRGGAILGRPSGHVKSGASASSSGGSSRASLEGEEGISNPPATGGKAISTTPRPNLAAEETETWQVSDADQGDEQTGYGYDGSATAIAGNGVLETAPA